MCNSNLGFGWSNQCFLVVYLTESSNLCKNDNNYWFSLFDAQYKLLPTTYVLNLQISPYFSWQWSCAPSKSKHYISKTQNTKPKIILDSFIQEVRGFCFRFLIMFPIGKIPSIMYPNGKRDLLGVYKVPSALVISTNRHMKLQLPNFFRKNEASRKNLSDHYNHAKWHLWMKDDTET